MLRLGRTSEEAVGEGRRTQGINNHEYRVAITPGGERLVAHGHEVLVETQAGVGSSIPDALYLEAGATILSTAEEVWGSAEMVLKVKEPVASKYSRMRQGQILFTYLHLAADVLLTEELLNAGSPRWPTRRCRPPTAHSRCWRR